MSIKVIGTFDINKSVPTSENEKNNTSLEISIEFCFE